MSMASTLRILSLVPETLPTFRVDVAILAGKYLPMLEVRTHLVGRPGSPMSQGAPACLGTDQTVSRNSSWRIVREWHYAVLAVRKLLSADCRKFALIQVRDMVSIGVLVLALARLRGRPFVYWMSYLMCEGRVENARLAWARGRCIRALLMHAKAVMEAWVLYRIVLPASDFVFVQSDEMLRYLAGKGVPAAKMMPVPMGVDAEEFARMPEPRRLVDSPDTPLIGYLGTLDSSRKLGVLIDALVAIRKAGIDAHLAFIGGSETKQDEEELLKHAGRLGLGDKVTITGWLARAEALQYLIGCAVCVSPIPRGTILDASSPTKPLEYLALGLACVANDNPDQRKVLEESGAGWLVYGDRPDYAGAILEVLRDPAAARARASRGPAYIAAHRSYAILAAGVAAQYRRIAGGG